MLLTTLCLLATTPHAPPVRPVSPVRPGPAAASQETRPALASQRDPLAAVRVSATLKAESTAAGASGRIVIELDAGPASTSEAGIPAPILQLDVPPSVKLDGREITDLKELARNEFLQEPYERLLKELPAEVTFTFASAPAAGETIGINVVGYLKTEAGDAFLRRRLELPLTPGAEARAAEATTSTWGKDEALLNIGQRAALFDLPRADGSRVALEQFLGSKNVIITTYRAHW